ncbi:MAG TPA: outer membrane protein assembly factor BamB [Chromatiales bacterium]|nr:outer membrane protein assembly factor BamB [Chromatiales bacterium]
MSTGVDRRAVRFTGAALPWRVLLRLFAAATLVVQLGGCAVWERMTGLFGEENVNPPAELPEIAPTLRVQVLWRREVGQGVEQDYTRLMPLVLGDTVYAAGARGKVAALDARSGAPRWEVKLDVQTNAGVNGGENLVAIGTSEGEVIALDPVTGEEHWRRTLTSEVMAISREVDETVIVRTNDGWVWALDARSGEQRWSTRRMPPPLSLRGQSRPRIALDRVVVGFDDGKLAAFSLPDGVKLWQATVAVPEGRSEVERLVDVDGQIRVRDGVVYAAAYHGRVVAVSLAEGRILWAREIGSHAGLDADDLWIYVTDDQDQVWALDGETGASLWKQDKLEYRRLSAPAVVGEYVVAGDFEGYLHWMDKTDGHFVARVEVDGEGILSPPVVVDGRLYVQGRGGIVAALAVGGETPQSP